MGRGRVRGWVVLAVAVSAGLAAAPGRAESPQITDAADDAYRYPGPFAYYEPKPPLAPLSNQAADLVSITFAKAAPRLPNHDAAYSVSVTVIGEPHQTYNYLVGGSFGDDCYLIHFLRAGETRKAIATCGSGEEAHQVGTLEGSTVAIKGNTISASFSFRRFGLPSKLKADPNLENLFAMSCPVTSQSWGCNDDVIDFGFAEPATTFRL